MIQGFEQVRYWCVATACTSDVAHSGPQCAQGACVYAQTDEKLEGTLIVEDKGFRRLLTCLEPRYNPPMQEIPN